MGILKIKLFLLIFILEITHVRSFAQTSVSELNSQIDSKSVNSGILENRIIDTIASLQEVKTFAAYLEKQTNGKRHMHIGIWQKPTISTPYYLVKVMEDNGDAYVTYYNFYVYPKTMTIKYLDTVTDEVLDLNSWRNKNK